MNEEYSKNFRIIIASVPYRQNCVCEIYFKQDQWVEISNEADEVMIQFYSPTSDKYWEFPLDIALEVLQRAKSRFFGK
jgi:hypothetical protein